MIPVTPNPVAGVTIHGTGALLAANCYTPQKFIRRWSWETFWIVQDVCRQQKWYSLADGKH